MRLFTFNFNLSWKQRVWTLLSLSVIGYLIINAAFLWLQPSWNKLEKYDTTASRFKLLKSVYATSHPDIIFVGSSTTLYHVSTQLFHEQNMNIFNYGVECHFLPVYHRMVRNAISMKPKVIAITIDINQFYYSLLYFDAVYNESVPLSADNLLFMMNQYRKTNYNADIAGLLKKLAHNYIFQHRYFTSRGYEWTTAFTALYQPPVLPKLNDPSQHNLLGIDCKDWYVVDNTRIACKNGDGILLGRAKNDDIPELNKVINLEDKNLNLAMVAIMNSLFEEIRKAGIRPVLVFSPLMFQPNANKALLKQSLHADIVDLTAMTFPQDHWYNTGHYNQKGRRLYSLALSKEMKKFM